MSQITEITSPETFQAYTNSLPSNTFLVICFHTPWAAPCAQVAEIIKTLAATYTPVIPPRISFLSLNAESLHDISESYDVTAVPFLVIQRDGKVLQSVSGSDAAKIRGAVERWVRSAEDEPAKKASLPAALEAVPRPDATGQQGSAVVSPHGLNNGESKDSSAHLHATSNSATTLSSDAGKTEELNARLAELVKAAPVMLFMKGTPSSPQCGFSRQLVGILREKGVRYGFFNILADEDVRQGLKIWADWPTYPQLWVGGELVGGLDIVSFSRRLWLVFAT